jgi:large repetitive protein
MRNLCMVTLLLFTSGILRAQLITPFSPVISVTQKGDITFASNSITTCTGTGTACTNGRIEVPPAGTTHNQTTGITIGYIDNDGSTGIGAQTFSSSSSTLNMGGVQGCGVIYAYLVWGGFITTGTANYAKRDSVYLQAPGASAYTMLKADLRIDNTAPYNATYHCYKDVTPLVKAAGPGVYTAANIVASTGANNRFAGWTLVVFRPQ